jgi:hypothetical protein
MLLLTDTFPGETELVLLAFVVAGIYCFRWSYVGLREYRRLRRHGEDTEGEVIGLVPVYDSDFPNDPAHARYYYLIRFRTRHGAEVTVQHRGPSFGEWPMGQRLALRYRPDNPQHFLLPTDHEPTEDWYYAGLLLGAAVVALSLGVCFW